MYQLPPHETPLTAETLKEILFESHEHLATILHAIKPLDRINAEKIEEGKKKYSENVHKILKNLNREVDGAKPFNYTHTSKGTKIVQATAEELFRIIKKQESFDETEKNPLTEEEREYLTSRMKNLQRGGLYYNYLLHWNFNDGQLFATKDIVVIPASFQPTGGL